MNKRLRLLLIEDSEDDALFLLRELQRGGFDIFSERVDTMARLTSALDREGWDLVISDHSLNGFNSLHALELVKQRKLDIPFIIVSGIIGEEMAVKAMKAGAHDYVMKDQLARLVPSIERELREAQGRRAQRKAEEALRRSEQELNDFFERASVGLQWLGPEGTILRVNQAELDLLGYKHEEYAGRRMAEFYVDKQIAGDVLKRLHAGEVLNNFEVQLRCKNGQIKHVLINANVLRENDKFIHARCFTRDITDRKQAEAARSYLAAIVESSEDAIIGTSLDGRILSWNDGAEQMYGYTSEQARGSSVSILAPLSRPEHWPQLYERVRCGEKIGRLETVRHRKDGASLEVSLTFSLIKDENGEAVGISTIERDITARKHEEAERSRLIAELTDALGRIKTLRGLLPICAACKKIRDDGGYWQKLEAYICEHTEAEFTHGICPECLARLYPQYPIHEKKATTT